MLGFFHQIRYKYCSFIQCAYKQNLKQQSAALFCSPIDLNSQVMPKRGMRGMRSTILHKEVIDKYRLKEQQKSTELDVNDLSETETSNAMVLPDHSDMPIPDLPNPYAKPPPRCLLCEHDVELDFKNVRLLSQFVSPHSGRIYGRSITGLCLYMQRRVAKLIKRSRYFGYMPYELKDPRFLKDPKLFDPFKRK